MKKAIATLALAFGLTTLVGAAPAVAADGVSKTTYTNPCFTDVDQPGRNVYMTGTWNDTTGAEATLTKVFIKTQRYLDSDTVASGDFLYQASPGSAWSRIRGIKLYEGSLSYTATFALGQQIASFKLDIFDDLGFTDICHTNTQAKPAA